MAGTTSWIISNLMSTLERLFQFMNPFPTLPPSSSSSSSIAGEVNSIQEKLMEDLNRLSRMLRRIQAVLHDAEEREIYDKTIQLWLSELREVACDAEDVLDEYDYQVIKTQVEGMTATVDDDDTQVEGMTATVDDDDDDGNLYGSRYPIPCNMAKRIMKIIEKFDEITKDRERLQLREEDGIRRSTFDNAMKRPPSSSLMHDSIVFGREDDKKKIIQLLLSDSKKEITIIPIIGMGGVGKTTLAQIIYNDPSVCEHFSPKVWVCVSEEFDVVRITKKIVTSIISLSDHHDNNDLNDLQCMLKNALIEKRFLLILDDVWNERLDKWEALRTPFFGVGMGKIIVTTRSKSVAIIMQTVPPHELGCLDEEESWLLFQKQAFCCCKLDLKLNFEKIGRQIVRKCGGLPLALKAIGGFLRYEVEEQTWLDVFSNDQWELEETRNLILPALRISYNHLPAHLKPCFFHASLYPRNYEFNKEELIKQWLAQDYIHPTGRKRILEDIACEYFDELQRRSFFQCSKYVDNFSLHDMVHDLARSITRNEICSLLDFEELKNIPKDTKHIFIKTSVIGHLMATTKFPLSGTIRTIYMGDQLYFGSNVLPQSNFTKVLFPHFGCLRVLIINAPEDACNLQFIDWIGNLQQLRYLSINMLSIEMAEYSLCSLYKLQTLEIKSNELCIIPHAIGKLINLRHLVLCGLMEMLPESICQLKNLLTSDISGINRTVAAHMSNYQLRELPLGISKLTNLRRLMLPEVVNFCIPCGIEKMINLQTLSYNCLKSCSQRHGIGWLKHMVNLRGRLKLVELHSVVSREDAKSANLLSKSQIEILKLYWGENIEDDECSQQQEAVLDGLQPHTNLKALAIEGYRGNNFPSWFGNPHFSNLTKIYLENFNSNEECKFLPLSGLQSLKTLHIRNIKGIRKMRQDFWCYPYLDGLEKNFTEVHVGFLSLELLSIYEMPEWEEWRTLKTGDFPSLKILEIINCPKLKLLPTLPSSLDEFTVKHCERLKHVALHDSSRPPSRLQKVLIGCCDLLTSVQQVPDLTHLYISECFYLKSVNRLNNLLTTLIFLNLEDCPLLQLSSDEYAHHLLTNISLTKGKFESAHVINCPGMKEWCQWHGFAYYET